MLLPWLASKAIWRFVPVQDEDSVLGKATGFVWDGRNDTDGLIIADESHSKRTSLFSKNIVFLSAPLDCGVRVLVN